MSTVIKKRLNRLAFACEMSLKVTGYPPTERQGSSSAISVQPRPVQVTYAPYKVPDWRGKIARSENATSILLGNDCKVLRTERFHGRKTSKEIYPQLTRYKQWVISGERFFNSTRSPPTAAPATRPLAGAKSSEQFVADYYEKTRSIRGLSTLAEAASTVRGLASPAKALRKEVDNLYNSLRRRAYRSNGQQVHNLADVVSGTWLEWQLGIRPIVSDVNGAAKAVNRLRDGDFRATVPIRGVGKDSSISYQTLNDPVSSSGLDPYIAIGTFARSTVLEIDETTVITRGAVRVSPPGGEVPPVMQFGVGFEDVLPAVWEGIPWSFFVDYFVNVSSVIDAWSMVWGRLSWANRTVRNSRTLTYGSLRAEPPSTWGVSSTYYSASGGRSVASASSVTRSQSDPRDLFPPFRVNLPVGNVRWANIGALASMTRMPGPPPRKHKLRVPKYRR